MVDPAQIKGGPHGNGGNVARGGPMDLHDERRHANASALAALADDSLRIRERAYAPYSHFRVGAAVVGQSGRVYVGCNVENASYGLCICAERNAVTHAVAEGETRIVAVAVATQTTPPCPPCGMCRQTLAEFASDDLPIVLVNPDGERLDTTLGDLLPMTFRRNFLDGPQHEGKARDV
jgi:cytidine deaminase